MQAFLRHWDLLVGLAVAIAVWWYGPRAENPTLALAIALAAGLIAAKIASSLGLLVRVGWWLVRETAIRPNPWTIIGGLVGVLWCIDYATQQAATALTAAELSIAAGVGYPLGAIVSLLPRGLVHGFGALRQLFTPRKRGTEGQEG